MTTILSLATLTSLVVLSGTAKPTPTKWAVTCTATATLANNQLTLSNSVCTAVAKN